MYRDNRRGASSPAPWAPARVAHSYSQYLLRKSLPSPPQSPKSPPREDSSGLSEEEESGYNDVVRPGEDKNVQEIDAESLIAPVISRTQSTALYRNAVVPSTPQEAFIEEDGEVQHLDGVPEFQRHSQFYGNAYPEVFARPSQSPNEGKGPGKKSKSFGFQVPSLQLPNVSLPSLPNVSLPSFSGVRNARVRSRTLFTPRPNSNFTERATSFFRPTVEPPTPHPPLRRRSSSTPSIPRIALSRTLSTTSSLGDDTKFLHVHSPSNARIKAILDGLPTFDFPQLAQLNPFTDPDPAPPPPTAALDALDTLTGDVVVLGGYRGSILRDKTNGNRRVWVPLKVGLNLRKVDLEVGLDPLDEELMHEKIVAGGMLTNIGPVDISKRLLKRLRSGAEQHGRRVHDWGYDWRLSPELLSARLVAFLEGLQCNSAGSKRRGALVIAHSLGGLITRHAVNQRPELFSGVVFAGTPQHCVNILGPLRNGDSVMLNSKVFTAQVNFTLRTSYTFLPEDGQCFIDRTTGASIPLDFFNIETWKTFRLSPCVSPPLPPPPTQLPDRTLAPQLISSSSDPTPQCTLPLSATLPYLDRTLASTLRFRSALAYRPELETRYPPMTVLYSKTSPTVRGARVDGVEGIKRADAYEELVFGAGDGVCLARAAMLPVGYRCVKRVAVDRGHITLLGDLEGVGGCVAGIRRERGW